MSSLFHRRFGRRIRAARSRISYSVERVAKEVGLSVDEYLAIEDGAVDAVDIQVPVVIAELTGKSLAFLLTGRSIAAHHDDPASR